jgi:outer membrane protein
MIMHLRWNKVIASVLTLFTVPLTTYSQNPMVLIKDTLKLEDAISMVMTNNPVIKQSGELVNASELAVKLAQSAWLPIIDANGSYSRMAPIPAFDIPQFGHIQMYPDNSVNFTVEAHQLLYDFGKTDKNVDVQRASREIASLTTEQIKEKLALATSGIFYSLFYIQTAQTIVEEHVNTLKKHLESIENKQKTGSATRFEFLSTQVKLSSSETQLSELQTAYQIQLSHLNALSGLVVKNVVIVADTTISNNTMQIDSVYAYALLHRDDLLLLNKKKMVSELNYKMTHAQDNPTLSMFGSGGMKNGYLPEIEKLKWNYIVGVTLKVPIFEGNRKNIKLKIAQCSINQTDYDIENTEHTANDEINENLLQLQLSKKKIEQSGLQIRQAREAYNHAEINFREGVITNLDLIFSADMLSESELQLLKNKVDYKINLMKLKVSMGERIY